MRKTIRNICLSLLCFGLATTQHASAQEDGPLIGLAAPLSENYQAIGQQLQTGVEAALAANGLAKQVYIPADTRCDAVAARGISKILASRGVKVVIGFACSEALEAGLGVLGPAGIPIITPVSRNAVIAERAQKEGWPLFRLAPSSTDERALVGSTLLERFAPELFAIVDDGTIYGRELAEAFRFYMEEQQLKPVYTDTFRPQMPNQIGLLGRLKKSGATHIFAAGDYEDIAIMARDAASIDYTITIAGGEALRAAPITATMPDGVLMVAPIEWQNLSLTQPTIETITSQGRTTEGYVLPAFAAAEIAIQSQSDDLPMIANLKTGTFQTAIGTLGFKENGTPSLNPFALHISRDGIFERVE